MDEHIIEGLGKTRVVIRDGKVAEVGDPQLSYCPIFDKHRGIKHIDRDVIARNMQFVFDDFSMCAPKLGLRMRDYLSFGIPEIIERVGLTGRETTIKKDAPQARQSRIRRLDGSVLPSKWYL